MLAALLCLEIAHALLQGKLVGRVFEWLLPQPVDDCLRVLSSCLLGGKNVTPLMCSTTETIGSSNADDGEDTVSHCQTASLVPSTFFCIFQLRFCE